MAVTPRPDGRYRQPRFGCSSGPDTDTVAAIAGGLVGAAAVPAPWRDAVHGWPGLRADGLAALAGKVTGRTGQVNSAPGAE